MSDMSMHSYTGDYRSAIARAKKVLVAAGFPWSVKKGRYTPYFNQQTVSKGVKVTRIGCSESIAIHVSGYWTASEGDRSTNRWIEALAIATLREAGLPFDDRGWLACGRDALKAQRRAS